MSSKVDPRVKRTRQLLQRAFMGLLHEKEFHQLTVQEITERAEVNRATFYAHFEDKYALLNATVQEDFRARLDGHLPDVPAFTTSNLRLLTQTVSDYVSDFFRRCPAAFRHNESVNVVSQVQVELHEMLLEWLEHTPRDRNAIPSDVAAMVTSWAIFGSVTQWVCMEQKLPSDQLTDHVLEFITSGIFE